MRPSRTRLRRFLTASPRGARCRRTRRRGFDSCCGGVWTKIRSAGCTTSLTLASKSTTSSTARSGTAPSRRRRRDLNSGSPGRRPSYLALIAAGIGVWALRPVPTAREARLEINTPPIRDPSLAISPDGLKVVFAAGPQASLSCGCGRWILQVARPLPGTERGSTRSGRPTAGPSGSWRTPG